MSLSKERAEQFLTHFGKDITKDVIECDSGDLSIVCNPDTEWKEFIGMSIFSVVKYYCDLTSKEYKYKQDVYGYWGEN